MFHNKIIGFILIQCFSSSLLMGTIENSIIPLVEKYEKIENLPSEKFSQNQFAEIASRLKECDKKIRLVSYNILFNKYDHNLAEENRWPQRCPRIAELIEEMNPDIMGVQELCSDQRTDLLAAVGNVYEFYSEESSSGEHDGIFYRKDRFELIDSHVWEMVDSGTLTMITLKELATSKSLAIFNTHLSFSKVDRREQQAKFIAEKIESFAPMIPVILTGDMNTFPNKLDKEKLPFYDGDYIHRIFTQSSLKDAREIACLGHLGPIGTFTNVDHDPQPFKGTGTPGIFLDHIYVSRGVQPIVHAVQPATVNGHFPSDHMPILLDFVLD